MTAIDPRPARHDAYTPLATGDWVTDRPEPASAATRSACLILNPQAGLRARAGTVERVLAVGAALGWQIDVMETSARGDATRLAAEAARTGRQIVLVGGGDGTLNEVIQGLAGTGTAVGALPLGTMNVWVRELGLPLDPADTLRELLRGQVRRIDLGRANGRYFLLMAGLGFDAEAMNAVQGQAKRRLGPVAILVAGAMAGLRSSGSRLRLRADGQVIETDALLMTVGNTRLWAGAVRITHHATAADGLLDVCIFPGRSLLTRLRHVLLVLLGRHDADPEVTYLQVRELLVAARPRLPLQIDGEPIGTTPARIEIAPGALHVLVGAGTAPALADAPMVEMAGLPVGPAHDAAM
jgi:YegS/Rv2252/BmrU family lipid kinase